MDTQTTHSNQNDFMAKRPGSRNSQIYTGLFILVFGVGILLKRMGAPIPSFLFGWETILIAIGVFMGLKSGFKDISWLIPIVIGSVFLLNDIFPNMRFSNIALPVGLILIGLIVLSKGFKGKAIFGSNDMQYPDTGITGNSGFKKMDEAGNVIDEKVSSTDDFLDVVSVFGGVKRTVVSKNFMGGEIVAVLGGAEIDLTHADIQGLVKLEATNVLGGTKLIVPASWDVQSEMVALFGGVEDKRRIQPDLIDRNKRLILMGTCVLGGLEIKSF